MLILNFILFVLLLFLAVMSANRACQVPKYFCNSQQLTLSPRSVYRYCYDSVDKTMAKTAPKVGAAFADKDKWYMLIMVDPDVPSPTFPFMKYWLHWLVVDIHGEDLVKEQDVKGKVIVDYAGPSTPTGSKSHRYQFMLLKQEAKGQFDKSVVNPKSRGLFELKKFLEKNKCDIVATYLYTS